MLNSPLLHSFNWVDCLFQKSEALARARQSAAALIQLGRLSLSKSEKLARARQSAAAPIQLGRLSLSKI